MQGIVAKLLGGIGVKCNEVLNWGRGLMQNWQSSKKKTVLSVTAGVLVVGVVAGGWFWQQHRNANAAVTDVVLVRSQVVGGTAATQEYTYSGEVRGRHESQLAFQVGGKVIVRRVELGSKVKAGDVLMQIDAKDIRQTVNIGSAQVYSTESQQKLAQNNLERYRRLYEQGAVSRAQYDQYVSAYEVAVAGARQAGATYSQSANQLDYSSLRSDRAGVVSAIAAEAGQVVGAGQTVVTVVQDGEREVEISAPENRIEILRQSPSVMVSFWALPQVKVAGKVREVAPMADTVTRTYKVRVSIAELPPEVTLGMTASVVVAAPQASSGGATEIPLAAVYQTEKSPSVWVVQNDVVSLRPVQVVAFGKTAVQVAGGLKPGEVIVTAGVHKLREGQKVRLAGGATE
jgi:RND family efflux transporter MFP subunit